MSFPVIVIQTLSAFVILLLDNLMLLVSDHFRVRSRNCFTRVVESFAGDMRSQMEFLAITPTGEAKTRK